MREPNAPLEAIRQHATHQRQHARGETSHTCDRTHADVHHSHVLQPAVTALIGLTNRVASEAFLPTNHHALPTQPARSPKGPKPREHGHAHATENADEIVSRAVSVLVEGQ